MEKLSVVGALLLAGLAGACSRTSGRPARQIADEYLDAWFQAHPDEATLYGVQNARHDRLPDRSLSAVAAWQAREDQWLRQLPSPSWSRPEPGSDEWVAAGILRERLRRSVAARICRTELWDLDPFSGWQINVLARLPRIQPVGSAEDRRAALRRWEQIPALVDTEIANLKEGLRRGYKANNELPEIITDQLGIVLELAPDQSPLYEPARRDTDPAFAHELAAIIGERIYPALRRYLAFLQKEYSPQARSQRGVTANPDGAECYRALVQESAAEDVDPVELQRRALAALKHTDQELQKRIAAGRYVAPSPTELRDMLRSDPRFGFGSRELVLAYAEAALGRARARLTAVFGPPPRTPMRLELFPGFREHDTDEGYDEAPPAYLAGGPDVTQAAILFVPTAIPDRRSRAGGVEATALREGYPGAHLQRSLALENPVGIARYLPFDAFTEGWGAYAESVADELGIYSSLEDRIGVASDLGMNAARVVIDVGLNLQGWSVPQAALFLREHTRAPSEDVNAEVERCLASPGRAAAAFAGLAELRAFRDDEEQRLGMAFSLSAFHRRVLESGHLPPRMVRDRGGAVQ